MRSIVDHFDTGTYMAGKFTILLATLAAVAAATPLTTLAQDPERDIAFAVMPLPAAHRDGATVLRRVEGGTVTLREGTGDFVCLTDPPGDERVQLACYHRSLEPYMARGRELSAEGVTGQASIHRRWEEINAGTLPMPEIAATLYQLTGDAATAQPGVMDGFRRLTVIYMPGATAESTGLSTVPGEGVPWLMYSGQPTAHVMIP